MRMVIGYYIVAVMYKNIKGNEDVERRHKNRDVKNGKITKDACYALL